MAPKWRSGLARYGLAVAIFAGLALFALLLSKFSIQLNTSLIVAVGLAAASWYGGRGPGLLLLGLILALTMAMNPVRADTS